MRKKLVSMLLALTLAASVLAGCGNEGEKNSEVSATSSVQESEAESTSADEASTETAEEEEIAVDAFAGTTLTIAMLRNVADISEDFNDKLIFQMAEEATGIHIEWVDIAADVASERVNLMLASDMPDAFISLINENQLGQEIDSFYDLSEEGLLETYAPDVLEAYATVEGGLDSLRWSDGSIRSLMTGSAVSTDIGAAWFINKVWLDQLGMDIPTTAEEFYEVLCAFRDNDMNGNGDTTDEIPVTFCNKYWAGDIMNFADCFGIPGYNYPASEHYYQLENGTVNPTMDTDNYRAFLEYFNKLASEGLLDVEGFTQTSEQHKAKIKEGKVGVCFGNTQGTHFNNDTLYKTTDYVVLPPFQGIEGVEPTKSGFADVLSGNRVGFVVSAECENVEALLHWWNWLHSSTEIKYIARFGAPGHSWDKKEDGSLFAYSLFQKEDELPEGMTSLQYLYSNSIIGWPPFTTKEEELPLDTPIDPSDYTLRQNIMDAVKDMCPTERLPIRFTDPEMVSERTFLEADLFDYIANFTAVSVTEGVTDASWEAHLKQLEALGYYDWIDWYQGFVDGEY